MKLNKNTVTRWTQFARSIITKFLEENPIKIGGPGKTVEVDEAKFGRRKNHKGRVIDGTWVFGGVDKTDNGQCFFVTVKNRSADSLLGNISKFILPGTTIVSDCWKGYSQLENHPDYSHLTVNHRYNFVDPITKATTNHIERQAAILT